AGETPIGIELERCEDGLVAALHAQQADAHAGGGGAVHRVEHVGAEMAHGRRRVETAGKVYTLLRTGQSSPRRIRLAPVAVKATPKDPSIARRRVRLRVIRATGPAPLAHGARDEAAQTATQRIVDSITAAVAERRLMPGTKLAEQKLADIFRVSRTLVRQALNQLSRDRLVRLEPARGATVAAPSVAEARQVFAARQLI